MADASLFALLAAVFGGVRLLQRRANLKQVTENLRSVRALASTPIGYEPCDERWQAALRGLEVPATMTALGDCLEVTDTRAAPMPIRAFASDDGVIFAWFALFGPRQLPVAMLWSSSEEDTYMTRLVPARSAAIASPPFVHREDVSDRRGIAVALARHRERIANVKGLRTVATLAELQAEITRIRARTIAWRQSQGPAELLDKDLRAALGRHYASYGPALARRLSVDMPEARVVS